MTARVVGAGAFEYKYSLDGKALAIFIDPVLKSTSFNRVPPNVLSKRL
ncbi:MAG: hypothetical protein NT051_04515 [Candidatus Micrarchaeota archaeon]|nr:hypothetical protein [Candidatus Micrarchaeota archaeon]